MQLRDDDSPTIFLAGVATGLFVGALAMFIFDPEQGRRRRALARDKMVRYGKDASEFVSGTAKDLSNRAYGVAKEAEGLVREKMGRGEKAGERSEQNPIATAGGV